MGSIFKMLFKRLFVMVIASLCLVPFTFAQDDTTTVPGDMARLVYFLPSDRTAQSDIDSKIDTLIKAVQTSYADEMEEHGFGRKTFTYETDDNGDAVVHHITGDYTDAYYDAESKWKVWDEIKEDGFNPSQNIYVAFVDLSSQDIDGSCGTGGDWDNGGVVTLTASGNCFEGEHGVTIAVHELGHAFGLRHDFRDHPDQSIDLATEDDPMVTSVCAAEWLDGHRYFNSYMTVSNESTTISMSSPSGSGSDFSLTFTIADTDGLHQAHFFNFVEASRGYDDLNLLDCKSLEGTSSTATFTTSALTSDTDSVALRVMDAVGSITEKQFSVDLTALLADANRDGNVNILDLVKTASNFGKSNGVGDVNGDGVVNIFDLTLIASAMGNDAKAPSVRIGELEEPLTKASLQKWLREARQMNLKDSAFQRGVLVLEQLLAVLTPKETVLLPNYPNPFNPETWIPYQLGKPAKVAVSIYAVDGQLVRTLELGHQPVDRYESRSRAAYWNGKNALGESVASGVYFYTLTADDFTATRKMLIRK